MFFYSVNFSNVKVCKFVTHYEKTAFFKKKKKKKKFGEL